MAMVCPQCNTTYEQRWLCPQCETRLLFHDARRHAGSSTKQSVPWRQRPWGRFLVGLVLAQGLFYGLRHFVTAGMLLIGGREAVEQMGTGPAGVLFLQGLQMFALFAATFLAAAGQQRAAFLGGMIGAWNGVVSVRLPSDPLQVQTLIASLGQPLLQAVMGAVAGWCSSAIWKPLPETNVVEALRPRSRRSLDRRKNPFSGPVAWVRVAIGVSLAVAGSLTAAMILEKILELGQGRLGTADDLQDQLITFEIKALAVLLSAAFAGATTNNGLKQGFCVGLASTVILIGIEMNYVDRWLQIAGYTSLAAFSLSLAGGWFGSQLFPPILHGSRGRKLGGASI